MDVCLKVNEKLLANVMHKLACLDVNKCGVNIDCGNVSRYLEGSSVNRQMANIRMSIAVPPYVCVVL